MTSRWQERAAVDLSPDDPAVPPGFAVPMAEPGHSSSQQRRVPAADRERRSAAGKPSPRPGDLGTLSGPGTAHKAPSPSSAVGSQETGPADPAYLRAKARAVAMMEKAA